MPHVVKDHPAHEVTCTCDCPDRPFVGILPPVVRRSRHLVTPPDCSLLFLNSLRTSPTAATAADQERKNGLIHQAQSHKSPRAPSLKNPLSINHHAKPRKPASPKTSLTTRSHTPCVKKPRSSSESFPHARGNRAAPCLRTESAALSRTRPAPGDPLSKKP